MLSLSHWDPRTQRPIPTLRWSAAVRHEAERLRDSILRGIGTDEPLIEEDHGRMLRPDAISISWRRPLRLDEINQMGQTPEVRARPGRP